MQKKVEQSKKKCNDEKFLCQIDLPDLEPIELRVNPAYKEPDG